MVNKFLAIGTLHEIAIHFYATHVKIRLSLDVNNQSITIQQTISRKWAKQQYDAICRIIPYLYPKIKGIVAKNGREPIYTMQPSSQPTRLIVSGNINEWHGNIYFNGQYIDLCTNMADGISIEVDGQWVDKYQLINVCGDWPREFHIPATSDYERRVYRLNLSYNAGYTVRDEVVSNQPYGLSVLSCQPLDEYIDNEHMKKILLELEIIGD